MMKLIKSRAVAVTAAAGLLVTLGGVGGAVAGDLINSRDIKNDSVRSIDVKNKTLRIADLRPGAVAALQGQDGRDGQDGAQGPKGDTGAQGPAGPAGPTGAAGKDGRDGLAGAVYRVAEYVNGGGGDATVACADDPVKSQKYTAIAGGVQADVPATTTEMKGEFDVAASFPGRMDWANGKPFPNRLDGWIVLGAGGHSDTLRVWALCVPTTAIPVEVTRY